MKNVESNQIVPRTVSRSVGNRDSLINQFRCIARRNLDHRRGWILSLSLAECREKRHTNMDIIPRLIVFFRRPTHVDRLLIPAGVKDNILVSDGVLRGR